MTCPACEWFYEPPPNPSKASWCLFPQYGEAPIRFEGRRVVYETPPDNFVPDPTRPRCGTYVRCPWCGDSRNPAFRSPTSPTPEITP
jgi:hypothetical protein